VLRALKFRFFKITVEFTVFNTLVLVAFGLLAAVTSGVVYLTITDWRDRRRRDQEKKPVSRRR
jgi:hypothetical protein